MRQIKAEKFKKAGFTLASFAIIVGVWWLLAETSFKQSGIVPNPIKTLVIVGREMQKATFAAAIFSTLYRSFVSFLISFAAAVVFAMAANFLKCIDIMLKPFIAICRSMPTIVLVLILWIVLGSALLPIVVGFLVVFPMCYENMYTAIAETDKKLIAMANVFKVPKFRQVTGIYLPAMLPYVFASLIAGFGLNIKVLISAEVLAKPAMSIGLMIQLANSAGALDAAFAWLVIAVVLSLLCEGVLKGARRLCLPYGKV